MAPVEPEHQDGTSDSKFQGGLGRRRPGELFFAVAVLLASLGLLRSAYGISGFEALSAPGALPMAAAFVMVATAAIIVLRTFRLPPVGTETITKDILPGVVLVLVAFLVAYSFLLRPLGFLPTSALFLLVSIKILGRRGWCWTLLWTLGSLTLIWLVFRIVFTVLLPAGIVPEAEFIQIFRDFLKDREIP